MVPIARLFYGSSQEFLQEPAIQRAFFAFQATSRTPLGGGVCPEQDKARAPKNSVKGGLFSRRTRRWGCTSAEPILQAGKGG